MNNVPDNQSILSNPRSLKFILLVVMIFASFYLFYDTWLFNSKPLGSYLELVAALSSQILNSVLGEDTYLLHNTFGLLSDIYSHDIAYVSFGFGSEGALVVFGLLAVIIAWPSSWLKKLLYIPVCLAVMFVATVVRLCLAYQTDVYLALHFDMVTGTILPIAFVVVALVLFLIWVRISNTHPFQNE